MFHRISKVLFIFMLAVSVGSFALAQRQTGSVAGTVTDEEGVPLPGVTLTLTGPNQMGAKTFVTSDGGAFRFPAVPPGSSYVVTAELDGFNTIKRGEIIVNVGRTVTITIQMTPTTLAEEITVTAETPAVDVTSSKISVNYSEDLINNIPVARDYYDIIKTVPGIVSEFEDELRTFSSHGGSARQNQVAVDGVNITDAALGEGPIAVPFDTYEEIEFELGFHPAEVSVAEGAYVNIVTKAGGNQFQGGANVYFFNESLTKSLIPSSEAEAVGLTEPKGHKRWADFSLSLGGPIVKDKFWFFLNGRYVDWSRNAETIVDGVFEAPHKELQSFVRFTFKPHASWKFSGVWKYTNFDEDYIGGYVDYYSSLESTLRYENANDHAVLVMANWIASQNTFFDFRFTYTYWYKPQHIQPDANPNAPYVNDLFTGIASGPGFWSQELEADKYLLSLSGTHFLDNALGGAHEIKLGVEYDKTIFRYEPFRPYPVLQMQWGGEPWLPFLPFPGGIIIPTTNGAVQGDFPVLPDNWRIGAYIQDSFTINNRLTLNLGIRYDEMHANANLGQGKEVTPALASDPVFVNMFPEIFTSHTMPDIQNIVVWKNFSPRLGGVYDVFGDGKTSIKASWARYSESFIFDYYFITSPIPSVFQVVWIDVDANKELDVYDVYIPDRAPRNPSTYDPQDYVDPNLKTPRTNEFIVGVERELFKDFSISLSYIHKKKTQINDGYDTFRGNDPNGEWWIPYTVTDPGWDGALGTEDDKQLTIYGVKAGAPPYERSISNPREAVRKYNAVEFVFQKRMSDKWQLMGSITWSKFEGNVGASYGYSGGNTSNLENPNGYVNAYGLLDMDRKWNIKLQGSYFLPGGFMFSGYYFHMSGIPWERTMTVALPLFTDPRFDTAQPSTVTVKADPRGSRRLQSRNSLDLRLEKIFNLGSSRRLGFFLDVLNVLGESWYDINQNPGGTIFPDGSFVQDPTYGQHYGANGLRTFKLSARFTF